MKVIHTQIDGVVIIEPQVFGDDRGYFFESYSQARFDAAVRPVRFVQDNESKSRYGVLRGLQDVRAIMLISFVSYILLNIPVGYFAAFVLGFGPEGLISGYTFGLTAAALMLWFRYRRSMANMCGSGLLRGK